MSKVPLLTRKPLSKFCSVADDGTFLTFLSFCDILPFTQVFIGNRARSFVKLFVDVFQAFGNVFMNGRFADIEMCGTRPNGATRRYDVFRTLPRSFFNIIPQTFRPPKYIYGLYLCRIVKGYDVFFQFIKAFRGRRTRLMRKKARRERRRLRKCFPSEKYYGAPERARRKLCTALPDFGKAFVRLTHLSVFCLSFNFPCDRRADIPPRRCLRRSRAICAPGRSAWRWECPRWTARTRCDSSPRPPADRDG